MADEKTQEGRENAENAEKEVSEPEKRIRQIALSYYARRDVQEAIFNFSKDREVVPRYFEGFGKRPDSLQYKSDIFEMVRKGATSFHCSEELWHEPLQISTEMDAVSLSSMRKGWDLLIDIDSKYLDYSKIAAELIVNALGFHGIKNVGVKFSVSGDTPILIKNKEEISLISISQAISLIKKEDKLKVLSLDKNKKLKFAQIYDYLEHNDNLYEITHEHSKVPLKATQHHSVFIFKEGQVLEKKVSEIKKGDFLITFNSKKNSLESENIEVTNTFQFGVNQHSKNTLNRKVNITKKLMRLIGYYLSEGHITNVINQTGFSFNKKEKLYINDCQRLLKKITNRKVSVRHPNSGSTQILIHSKEWASFFENFCGKGGSKHIPNFSWYLSKDLFLEMLRGYIRGDGHKTGEYGIAVKSVCQKLIKELVWLCKLNGISCSLSTEKNKPHKLPQGNMFKGSFVYIIRIPKSEIKELEFFRKRNKFSPYPRDRTFPVSGLKKVYYQIRPKRFNYHRAEQMTLKKKRANLERIKKVINWFEKFKSKKSNKESRNIINNYKSLFNSDIGTVEIKSIKKIGKSKVYDVAVEKTESFFGNDYPILLHNSGNKGFHILVPWNAFPEEINTAKTSTMFPEWPRMITRYLSELIKKQLIERVSEMTTGKTSKYIKGEEEAGDAVKKVMPDIVLVSPRHLFRMPYSLHEKTSLASVVVPKEKIADFSPRDANPLKIKPLSFMPEPRQDEARELLIQAMDWHKEKAGEKSKKQEKRGEYKEFIIKDIREEMFPPCVKKILEGMKDGRKRALFILINFFSLLNLEQNEIEKRIEDWNKKNPKPLPQNYVSSQLSWHFKQKRVLPPNCDKDYYNAIQVCAPDEFCSQIKNPVNYTIKKYAKQIKQKRH